jgi:hypothetical protein
MLAVKLHRDETPWLGTGSYLVPIFNWEVGFVQVKTWIKILNNRNRGRPNHYIRYMTQVRIPDDLTVRLHGDFAEQALDVDYKPWEEISQAKKQQIADFWEAPGTYDMNKGPFWDGQPHCPCPELILGEPLPEDYILWTKDLFLLYRGD